MLQEEVKKDVSLVRIRAAVEKGEQIPTGFSISNNVLLYKGRNVLAKSSPFIVVLLREYHDSPLGGHAGELKTCLCMAGEWYWEGMRNQVIRYVRECQVCQQAKSTNQSSARLLQNLPTPSQV